MEKTCADRTTPRIVVTCDATWFDLPPSDIGELGAVTSTRWGGGGEATDVGDDDPVEGTSPSGDAPTPEEAIGTVDTSMDGVA